MSKPKRLLKLTAEEIEARQSPKGGYTKATLASWGVPWPPPSGWKQALIAGLPLPDGLAAPSTPDGIIASSKRPSACPESKLLQLVVMAVINAGHSDILKGFDELNAYYGSTLPTVADVIGGRPKHAIITGGISFDDNVYRFTCARAVSPSLGSSSDTI
jgi:hypothetical protein